MIGGFQMAKENEQKGKVSFLQSIRFKIMILVLISVVIATSASIFFIISRQEENTSKTTQSSMMDLISAYGKLVDMELVQKGTLEYESYAELLSDVKLDGMNTSYAYLVTSDGIMQYHPTQEKVGAAVENEVVSGLVTQIQGGAHPVDGVTSYLFKGVQKYAGYTVLEDNSILVITVDEKEIMAPMTQMAKTAIIMVVLIIILFVFVAYGFGTIISRPIKLVTEVVMETSTFNFKASSSRVRKIRSRKDEVGAMARAVSGMRSNLRDMVTEIEGVSHQITGDITLIKSISNDINSMCTDNSATTEELAASMEETAATTETINSNMGHMQKGATDIKTLSIEGEEISGKVMERAKELKNTTEAASKRTEIMFSNVKEKTKIAIEDSKAVEKINELTDAIMAISSQTGLLALNASIEAARAGEAGKGFAVVATEIGNLANQTSKTVGDINSIVKEVNLVVSKMTESLVETADFLENVVNKDYDQFREVSVQYSDDAVIFKDSMEKIEESISTLTNTISEIVVALDGINSTVNESTMGVTDIAEKTTDVVTQTVKNYELVENCMVSVEKLNEIAEMFLVK